MSVSGPVAVDELLEIAAHADVEAHDRPLDHR
jgi:hypothetical protein